MNYLLRIDLSTKTYEKEEIPAGVMDKFLGGRGLGAYYLYKNVDREVEPLSPENVLIFSSGPLQGTSAFYNSRCVLHTKSPLTGIYLYSVASGILGAEIRKCGLYSVIVKGRADSPVYVVIKDDSVEFRPAERLWGMKTFGAAEEMLKDANLPGAASAVIGPAGENLIKTAAIITEGKKARTFGRGGCGAVMGSKNLKGVVVSGSQKVPVADEELLKSVRENIRQKVKENSNWADAHRRHGTGRDVITLNELGIVPTRNWNTGIFEGINGIAPTELEDTWPRTSTSCGPNCINPCAHIIEIDRGQWNGALSFKGPEYETIYAFGADCGVDKFDAVVKAEHICNEYGIDTMSCGAAIAFAMECFEKGLITSDDTGGLDLRFGNSEAMVEMTQMIAEGRGFGELLGRGVKAAAQEIRGSEDFAIHCKGLELGGYECRGLWGQALQSALNTRGGCHHGFGLPARSPAEINNGTQVEGKGDLVKNAAIDRILYDSALICSFTKGVVGAENLLNAFNAVTGMNYSMEVLKKSAFRVITLERMFNLREGLKREDDYLPGRLLHQPLPDGPRKGSMVPMEELLDEGYSAFGWDKKTGKPKEEILAELDLDNIN